MKLIQNKIEENNDNKIDDARDSFDNLSTSEKMLVIEHNLNADQHVECEVVSNADFFLSKI